MVFSLVCMCVCLASPGFAKGPWTTTSAEIGDKDKLDRRHRPVDEERKDSYLDETGKGQDKGGATKLPLPIDTVLSDSAGNLIEFTGFYTSRLESDP